jgi:hypothetical protein
VRPNALPEAPDQPRIPRRYQRPRSPIAWFGVILGLAVGIGGGLFYTWVLNPVVEFDTQPWQLNAEDRQQYIVAIMLDYGYTGDLARAMERLGTLRPQRDPIQEVADIACSLSTSAYVNNSSGLRAVRAMMRFYQLQNRTGCADQIVLAEDIQPTAVVLIELPTPSLTPPATKTATPEAVVRGTPTPGLFVVPTTPPQSDYEIANIPTFCSQERAGLIEVNVVAFNGQGIPGQRVRVRWDGGESIFATGLKPERDLGFADFQMEPGISYIVDMPGLSDPSQPLTATTCALENGDRSVISYRVILRPAQ